MSTPVHDQQPTGARYHPTGPPGITHHGTVSGRVARIVALPALVILVLLGLLAAGLVSDYGQSQSSSRSVTLALAVQDLVHELQTERGVTAAVLGGDTSFQNEVEPARRRVDTERTTVRDAAADVGGADSAGVDAALQDLGGLTAIRTDFDAKKAQRAATFAFYTARIASFTGVDVGLEDATDATLRRDVAKFQALQDLTEATAQERAFLIGVFSAGGFAPGEYVQFADMRAARQNALTRFDRLADGSERTSIAFVFDTGAARTTTAFEQVALSAADGRTIVVNPQAWWSGLTTVLDDLDQLQEHVGTDIQVRAHEVQQASALRLGGLVGIVLLFLLGSIWLAIIAARSITRPLAALAAEANNVAVERLPAAVSRVQADEDGSPPAPPGPVQVPERSTQEIRSVAKALDRLQTAAYGLAGEQAVQRRDTIEALANLGRRNQNLIRRQLGFITTLEREEVDPTALANLFELDHLATRMRRNASSLLVLVGASSPRQWTTAVPVGDVIRAAVSEVEEYRRVNLRRVDDTLVNGSVIGSVAHLLSELIENGLTFSPPDTEVEVQGRRVRDGYLIAITDQGVGMSQGDLRQANARLHGEGDFIAAPTRFLGHYVVGRLAQETGVEVELLPSPVTGVTARVTLPQSLLAPAVAIDVSSDSPAAALSSSSSVPPASSDAIPIGSPVVLRQINRAPAYDDPDSTPSAGLPILPYAPASTHAEQTPARGATLPVRANGATREIGAAEGRPVLNPMADHDEDDAHPVGAHGDEHDQDEPVEVVDDVTEAGHRADIPPEVTVEPEPQPVADEDVDVVEDVPVERPVRGFGAGFSAGAPTGPLPRVEPAEQDEPEVGTVIEPPTPAPPLAPSLAEVTTPASGIRVRNGGQHPVVPDRAPAAARWGAPAEDELPRRPLLPPAEPRPAAGSANGPSTPAGGTSTPARGTSTPARGTGTPARGTVTPARGTSTPAAGTPQQAAFTRMSPEHGWPSGVGTELTRNGLRKRTPRDRRPAPERRVIDLDAAARASRATPDAVPDSPSDVGARLTALRAGLARGKDSGRDRPTPEDSE